MTAGNQPSFSSTEKKSMSNRVIIESPYRGDRAINDRYLREAMRDSLKRGEAPFASHGLYTQEGVLNDADIADRELGIRAGWRWMLVASLVAVYADLGISEGMRRGIERAGSFGIPIVYRNIRLGLV